MEVSEYIKSRIGRATDTEKLVSELMRENCSEAVGLLRVKRDSDSPFREVVWPFNGGGYLFGKDVSIIYYRDFDAEAIKGLSFDGLVEAINEKAISELKANVFGDEKVAEILGSVPDGEHVAIKVLESGSHRPYAGMEILIIGGFCMYRPYPGEPSIKSLLNSKYSGFLLEPNNRKGMVTVGEGMRIRVPEPCEIDPFFGGRETEEVLAELFSNGLKGGYPSI